MSLSEIEKKAEKWLNDKLKISNKTTEKEIIKTGVLEKIFGGIGKGPTPTP